MTTFNPIGRHITSSAICHLPSVLVTFPHPFRAHIFRMRPSYLALSSQIAATKRSRLAKARLLLLGAPDSMLHPQNQCLPSSS